MNKNYTKSSLALIVPLFINTPVSFSGQYINYLVQNCFSKWFSLISNDYFEIGKPAHYL